MLPAVQAISHQHFNAACNNRKQRVSFLNAAALTKVAEEYPAVTIGSYPRTEQSQTYGVKLILQSRDQAALKAASEAVQAEIPTYSQQ